jgi:hypothetical protein
VASIGSIFERQQEGCRPPISFRDDPQPFATIAQLIRRQQTRSMCHGEIVRASIGRADNTPITSAVPPKQAIGVGAGSIEKIERTRCGNNQAKREQGTTTKHVHS